MQFRFFLVAVVVALIAHHVVAGSVVDRLKARVNNAPKAPKKIDPKDPNFDLDEALPVHADYHAGGWTVTNLDDKLVDRAARKIIREIKPAKKEDKPKKGENKYALTPEEHAALKKLLADADVLVKRASKVAGADAADVAASAVKNAKKIQKPSGAAKSASGAGAAKTASGAGAAKTASGAGAAKTASGAGASKTAPGTAPGAAKTATGATAPAGSKAAPSGPAAAKTATGTGAAPAAAKTA